MAFVIVEQGNSQDIGKRFTLGENVLLIGRSTPESESDINLHDDFVSRHHAEITNRQNHFELRDLKSTNGTTINERRIEAEKFYPLKHDSVIGLGITPEGPRVILRFLETLPDATTRVEEEKSSEVSPVHWLRIDKRKSEIQVDEKLIIFSRKEFDLLLFLYQNVGRVCYRDELISAAWPEVDDTGEVSDAAIDQLIHRIRIKIEPDPSRPKRLISRKGFGYILV
jgi:pSer/pThr/pTyr-binding forkhead associated (FHA) protein